MITAKTQVYENVGSTDEQNRYVAVCADAKGWIQARAFGATRGQALLNLRKGRV